LERPSHYWAEAEASTMGRLYSLTAAFLTVAITRI